MKRWSATVAQDDNDGSVTIKFDPPRVIAAQADVMAMNSRLTMALQDAVDNRPGWHERAQDALEADGDGFDCSSYVDQLEVERDELIDRIKDLGG